MFDKINEIKFKDLYVASVERFATFITIGDLVLPIAIVPNTYRLIKEEDEVVLYAQLLNFPKSSIVISSLGVYKITSNDGINWNIVDTDTYNTYKGIKMKNINTLKEI